MTPWGGSWNSDLNAIGIEKWEGNVALLARSEWFLGAVTRHLEEPSMMVCDKLVWSSFLCKSQSSLVDETPGVGTSHSWVPFGSCVFRQIKGVQRKCLLAFVAFPVLAAENNQHSKWRIVGVACSALHYLLAWNLQYVAEWKKADYQKCVHVCKCHVTAVKTTTCMPYVVNSHKRGKEIGSGTLSGVNRVLGTGVRVVNRK